MDNKYGYSTDYVCSNCGGHDFEGTCCMDCGKFVGQSLGEYEYGILSESVLACAGCINDCEEVNAVGCIDYRK